MINDLIYNEMIQVGADGVDFVPIWVGFPELPPVLVSYTKDQWLSVKAYPRSNRVYWKIDGSGNKVYFDERYNQKPINPFYDSDFLISHESDPDNRKHIVELHEDELIRLYHEVKSALKIIGMHD